jgi:alpha-L-fucosidase
MYGAFVQWHTAHFGPPDKFGYKDFIPMFKAEKYDPAAWAALFKRAGAKYVVPVGEHHDGFAMWDSSLTKWCAGKMGPKRDLIGDLAAAVKNEGLIFGVSSHRMEHHTFMYPTTKVKTDLFDPQNADFYGPPVPGEMNDGNASPAFQDDWLARCQELVDKYQPQMLWFDNGVNDRNYDSVKLKIAAYYYNRAATWGKQVTISTKDSAYLAGSVLDFEKAGRGPRDILPGAWQIDDAIGTNSWGYVTDMKYRSTGAIVTELIQTAARGGNLLLNISPMADGTIPSEQQTILGEIGHWLGTNGDAIYGTRPWSKPSEELQSSGGGGRAGTVWFTTKGRDLYAHLIGFQGDGAVIRSLAPGRPAVGSVRTVTLLGGDGALKFSQTDGGLTVTMPSALPADYAHVLKIEGGLG